MSAEHLQGVLLGVTAGLVNNLLNLGVFHVHRDEVEEIDSGCEDCRFDDGVSRAIEPQKVAKGSLVDGFDDETSPVSGIIGLNNLEFKIPTTIRQDVASHVFRVKGWKVRHLAYRRSRDEVRVVGDVEDPLAVSFQVLKRCRRLEGLQLEPGEVGTDARSHRREVAFAVLAECGYQAFEDHWDSSLRDRDCLARWLTSGRVRNPQSRASSCR